MTSSGRQPGDWLSPPFVCLVTDGRRQACDLVDRVEAAVQAGVRLVQVREKQLSGRDLFRVTLALLDRIGGRAALLVNDRLDVALSAGAQGVHLPAAGLPIAVARRLAPSLLVGRSVHAAEEAVDAAARGADYLLLGTIFATASHPSGAPAGLGLVKETRARLHATLLVAIGGINRDNAAATIEAGADGVAVISAILGAPDPSVAAARLVAAVQEGWATRRGTSPRPRRDEGGAVRSSTHA